MRYMELLQAALEYLASEIERVEWNNRQQTYEAPIGNNGGEYLTETFEMRAYCWCDHDRTGHEEQCPPNFKWRDFELEWYKYIGRGMVANREMKPSEIARMLGECLESVRKRDCFGDGSK